MRPCAGREVSALPLLSPPIRYATRGVPGADAALLQAQPWWGNEPLAFAIAGALQYQLGDLEGGPGTTPGIPSALLAYGIIDPSVSITFRDGAAENCPSSCPDQGQPFFYVTGSVVSARIPTLSERPLLVLSLLTGLAGLYATRQVLRRG